MIGAPYECSEQLPTRSAASISTWYGDPSEPCTVVTGLDESSLLGGKEVGGGANDVGGAIVGVETGDVLGLCGVVGGNRVGPVGRISPPVACPLVLVAQPLAQTPMINSAASSRPPLQTLPTIRNAKGSPWDSRALTVDCVGSQPWPRRGSSSLRSRLLLR